jgi:hypothetical protein
MNMEQGEIFTYFGFISVCEPKYSGSDVISSTATFCFRPTDELNKMAEGCGITCVVCAKYYKIY